MRRLRIACLSLAAVAAPAMDLLQPNAWWGPMETDDFSLQILAAVTSRDRAAAGDDRYRERPAVPDGQVAGGCQSHRDNFFGGNFSRFGFRAATDPEHAESGQPLVAGFATMGGILGGVAAEAGISEQRLGYLDGRLEFLVLDGLLSIDGDQVTAGIGTSLRAASLGAPMAGGVELHYLSIDPTEGDSIDAVRLRAWGSLVIDPQILLSAGVQWQSSAIAEDGSTREAISASAGIGWVW